MATAAPLELENDLDLFLELELSKELLRFTTAGSVDDGKSTLIGRLLYDSKSVYEDQLDSVKRSRINRSGRAIDFSLLTDGLRAEREQGITIDVAYRYFSTPRRKFIIADTPGHEQYTRNMVTGASTADLAVILIDATKGLLPQTRRHAFIASLLGITNVLAAVNKMDLVDFREDVFQRFQDEFAELATALAIPAVRCVPISALDGDNVVARSERTAWYEGPTLLEHLETVPLQFALESEALRFPVQSVIRPDATFRGFAGRVASGTLRPGDEVLALPSRRTTRVESIVSFDGQLDEAGQTQSVVLKLTDEIDLSRGDLLVSPGSEPYVSKRFSAMVVWLHPTALELNRSYLAKHAGREMKIHATEIRHRVDINQLTEHAADHLEMNEIALVDFETIQSVYFDAYQQNRTTGSLILIDPLSNATVGAVMIREEIASLAGSEYPENETLQLRDKGKVTLKERIRHRGHSPAIFVLTGQRSVAETLERELLERGFETALVHRGDIPTTARRSFFKALWNLGLVVIAWGETSIRLRDKRLLAEVAGESLFDLSSSKDQTSEQIDLSEATRVLQSSKKNHKRFPGGEN